MQMVLEYKQSKACASFCFSASLPQIGYLLLWMHQGLSPRWFITSRGIRATHNMKSRLAIKFPTPMSSDQCPRKDANQGNKMITFRLFKTTDNYKCEDNLHQVTNTRHRIALTKLRLSIHKLAIETGRYSRPFKKPAERTCPICKIEMEDEYHFHFHI